MREIKFRAWLKEPKSMEMVLNLDLLNDAALVVTDYTQNYGSSAMFERKEYELMQYTNLIDKNGVEIYEGDLVSWADGTQVSEVYWCPADVCFSFRNEHEQSSHFISDDAAISDSQVIGNIHEHPELLGADNE